MPTRRQSILEAVVARLRAIRSDSDAGFETDAGDRVYIGEVPSLTPDDPETVIVVSIQDTTPTYQGANVFETLPLEIHAVAREDIAEPVLAAERVLGDVILAMELADRTLGGLVPRQFEVGPTRTLERQPGMTSVGVSIEYRFPYLRAWGLP